VNLAQDRGISPRGPREPVASVDLRGTAMGHGHLEIISGLLWCNRFCNRSRIFPATVGNGRFR
jgi:hypothetical protein